MLKYKKYYGEYTDGGSRNSFYTIKDSKYGFKEFPNKDLAMFSYVVQKKLSEHNLAPYVHSQLGRISIPEYTYTKEGKTKTQDILSGWGYLTEVAQFYECANRDTEYECDDHCYYEGNCKNYDKISALFDMASKLGIEYSDGHNGNLGWVRRNRKKTLVIIDLGHESIGDYDSRIYPNVDDNGYYGNYANYNNHSGCSCTGCRGS